MPSPLRASFQAALPPPRSDWLPQLLRSPVIGTTRIGRRTSASVRCRPSRCCLRRHRGGVRSAAPPTCPGSGRKFAMNPQSCLVSQGARGDGYCFKPRTRGTYRPQWVDSAVERQLSATWLYRRFRPASTRRAAGTRNTTLDLLRVAARGDFPLVDSHLKMRREPFKSGVANCSAMAARGGEADRPLVPLTNAGRSRNHPPIAGRSVLAFALSIFFRSFAFFLGDRETARYKVLLGLFPWASTMTHAKQGDG